MWVGPYVKLAAGVALFAFGAWLGVATTKAYYQGVILQKDHDATTQLQDALAAGYKVEDELRKKLRATEAKSNRNAKVVQRIVSRPVYHDCKLDADGLRVWNSAAAGLTPTPPGSRDLPPTALPE